jgi:Zn ribbon nucleic-acid-binding protein
MKISNLEKIEEGRYAVTSAVCPECNTAETIEVSSKWVFDMNRGGRVSELLPTPQHSMATRERFISGLCGVCWNKVMMGVGV